MTGRILYIDFQLEVLLVFISYVLAQINARL